jgi:hypothetical protein
VSPRRAGLYLIYAFTALAISLLLVETAVRVLEIGPPLPPRHKRAFIRKEHLPYHPTPNTRFDVRTPEFSIVYHYNDEGLRDRDRPVEKPPDTIRVLGLGDSFTEGRGVNFVYMYLTVLERMLRDGVRPPAGVDVVKAGVGGYDTKAERLYLEHYGVRYEPDVVIVGFSGTDVFDAALGQQRVMSQDGYLLTRGAYAIGPWGVELFVRSRAARIVLKSIVDRARKDAMLNSMSEDELRALRALGWERIDRELTGIMEIVQSIGASMVVLYIPLPPPFESYAIEESRWLGDWARDHAVGYVDMLADFRRHPDPRTLYFPRDHHCTQEGNRRIADQLFRHFHESDLLLRLAAQRRIRGNP